MNASQHGPPRTGVSAGTRADIAGTALVVLLLVQTTLSGLAARSSAAAVLGLIGAIAGAYVVGRLLGAWRAWLPALVAATAGLVGFAMRFPHLQESLRGLFGYGNAKAAFFFVGLCASLMLVVATDTNRWIVWLLRCIGALSAAAFLAGVLVSDSIAAIVVSVCLPVVALLVGRDLHVRIFAAVCAVLVVAAIVATMVLGSMHQQPQEAGALEQVTSGTRPSVWHDALDLTRARPLTGFGPGGFATHSPVALSDSDRRWAHSLYLQQGAEYGIAGLILTVGVVMWAFLRLGIGPMRGRISALAVAALCGFALQASIDYIAHFPAVPIVMALVVAAGTATRRQADAALTPPAATQTEMLAAWAQPPAGY